MEKLSIKEAYELYNNTLRQGAYSPDIMKKLIYAVFNEQPSILNVKKWKNELFRYFEYTYLSNPPKEVQTHHETVDTSVGSEDQKQQLVYTDDDATIIEKAIKEQEDKYRKWNAYILHRKTNIDKELIKQYLEKRSNGTD